MEIYSNVLRVDDIFRARFFAQQHGQDIVIEVAREHASRKAARGITVYCESILGKRSRNGRPGRAATWDAYGYMMVYLYNRDPNAIIGQYKSLQDFRVQCERISRYRTDNQHTGNFLELLAV